MKRALVILAIALVLVAVALRLGRDPREGAASGPAWSMEASVIEASTCPVFCQCQQQFRRFNSAYLVNFGKFGVLALDGAKFWIAGDLGSDTGGGEMSWAVLTFDKATTREQRDALGVILNRLLPVKWQSFSTAEGDIEWTDLTRSRRLAPRDTDYARATLDGGRTAEVSLKRPGFAEDPSQDTMIQNLRYWGAKSNNGFVLMPAEVQAWRSGDKKFEYKGTDGFTLTFHIDSRIAASARASKP